MKIFYGVAGEGMGHAIRSRAILEELKKKNEVIIFCGGRTFNYLKKYFREVNYVPELKIIYDRNTVCSFLTGLANIQRVPEHFRSLQKLNRLIKKLKPELIITDFMYQLSYLAWLNKTRCVSIDNQHSITRTDSPYPGKWWWEKLKSSIIVKSISPYASKYFVTSFFPCKANNKKTIIIKPIIRKEVVDLKSKEGENILVYQTSSTNIRLLEILKKIPEKFVIYGFHKNKAENNCKFKKFNEKEFYHDLYRAKAVITNGGFTLLSEALYLQKPILSIPVKKQFEQLLNAYNLQRNGLGMYSEQVDEKSIRLFLRNLRKPRKIQIENIKKLCNALKANL